MKMTLCSHLKLSSKLGRNTASPRFLSTRAVSTSHKAPFSSAGASSMTRADSSEVIYSEMGELRNMIQRQDDMLTQVLIRLQNLDSSKKSASPAPVEDKVKTKATPKPPKRNARGFVEVHRHAESYRPARQRVRDWGEINQLHPAVDQLKTQATRCMDCGTPFCQTHTGCPIHNLIPEWNELALNGQWKLAYEKLASTNNFPEFTGRVCPAPCEGACVAGLIDESVTIKNIEYAIIDRAFEEGWVKPRLVPNRTGKKVAVIGSGPAGLACADMLNQEGHSVTVYERADMAGGLMQYGIPNMKIDKRKVQRRIDLLRDEGIEFVVNADVGKNIEASEIESKYDATVLAAGSTIPRSLGVPGEDAEGVYMAMDFLTSNQKSLGLDEKAHRWGKNDNEFISVEGKDVIVIGGGDTGTDCIATSLRQYCKSLVNLELLAKSPEKRNAQVNPWPLYPKVFKADYGHEESATLFGKDPRKFSVMTKEVLKDEKGKVRGIKTVQVSLGRNGFEEVKGTEKEIPAQVVILALGFLGPEQPLLRAFDVEMDDRGNVSAEYGRFSTTKENIFAAGDCRRGQSLVVWAINEGRGAAEEVHKRLMSPS